MSVVPLDMSLWQKFTHKTQLQNVVTERDSLGHGGVTMQAPPSVVAASGPLGSDAMSLENKNSKKHEQIGSQYISPKRMCLGTSRPLSLRLRLVAVTVQ